MFNLTRQEKTVIIIFFSVILCGATISYLSKKIPQVEYIDKLDISGVQKINLNTATKEAICKIPGVGEILAEKIIALRDSKGTIRDLAELKDIKVIKDKKLEVLKKYLSVE